MQDEKRYEKFIDAAVTGYRNKKILEYKSNILLGAISGLTISMIVDQYHLQSWILIPGFILFLMFWYIVSLLLAYICFVYHVYAMKEKMKNHD